MRLDCRRVEVANHRSHHGIVRLAACRGGPGHVAEPDDNASLPQLCRPSLPAEIISHAVWLYLRFPLSLRHVDEILAARGITVSHETVQQWGLKFGQRHRQVVTDGYADDATN